MNRQKPRRPGILLKPAEHLSFMEDAQSASGRKSDLEHRGNAMLVIEQEGNQFSVGREGADQDDDLSVPRLNSASIKPEPRSAAGSLHTRNGASKPQRAGTGGHANGEPFHSA
jgi:hypothetical protein